MSDSNGPVRRRRIAGEPGPAAPAQKPVVKKGAAAKKAAAKKSAAQAPAGKAAAKSPAGKTPAGKTPAGKAPAPKTPASTSSRTPVAKKSPVPRTSPATASSSTPSVARRPTVTKPVVPQVPTRTSKSDGTAPKADRPAGSRPSRRDLLWLVPASLVAVAALVAGAWFVISPPGASASSSELDASQRQASSAAASAAEAIFSFRYDQLDQHLTASKALMTPAFAKEFDTIAPALTELAPQRKIVVQAVARESAALPCGSDCSTTKADVLVFVDQARLVGDGTQPTVFANRIKVSLVKNKDGWLVSNIRAL